MQQIQQILVALNEVPAEAWTTAVEVVVSALIVSPVALGLKKWWKIEGDKVMVGLVMLASLLAAVVLYLQSDPRFSPWVVAVQGALTFAATQPWYHFFVKPVAIRTATWFTSQVEQAAQLNDVKSATVPASGLPIGDQSKV